MSSTSRAVLGGISAAAVLFVLLTYILAIGVALSLATVSQLAGELMASSGRPVIGSFYIYSRYSAFPISVTLSLLTYTCIFIFVIFFATVFRSRYLLLLTLH